MSGEKLMVQGLKSWTGILNLDEDSGAGESFNSVDYGAIKRRNFKTGISFLIKNSNGK